MDWFALFVKENLIKSFGLWEKTAGVFALLSAAFAAIFAFVIRSELPGLTAGGYVGIGMALWFALLVLVVTPARMAIEKVQMCTKRLRVVGSENYECGRGHNWLRLKVENPTGKPVANCYGKLVARKMVATNLTKVDGQEVRLPISAERGGQSLEVAQLPPEGHRFPWSPESAAETIVTIPGFRSVEYLYYGAKGKSSSSFGFPSGLGMKYANFSLGDFELEIEVGSESEGFEPTRVCVTLRADGGDLKFVSLKDVYQH